MQFKFTHCGKAVIWIGDIFGSQQEHYYKNLSFVYSCIQMD